MSDIVARARRYARKAHAEQQRKYTGEPYFNHCHNVAEIVRTVPHTDSMIAAAYLHDTVEDTPTTIEDISELFGVHVAVYVRYLTDVSRPSDGNRGKRKALDRKHIANAPPAVKTIKLADLIDNSVSILKHDPDFARVYLREKRLLLSVLRDGDPDLWSRANKFLTDRGY